jgi:hypothetical protein
MIEFEINDLPKTINALGRAHWAVKVREVKKWKHLIMLYALRTKNDFQPFSPLKKAKLTLTRFSSVEPDFDGLVSSFKVVIDGLIYAQVIEDDKQSNIGQPTYLHVKSKRKEGKIKVRVEAA